MAASLSEAELEAIKWDEAVIELYPQVSLQTLSPQAITSIYSHYLPIPLHQY